MARCGLLLFCIVVAVATGVANCVYDASAETTTEDILPEYDDADLSEHVCGPNEIWSESGIYIDARCSPPRPRYRSSVLTTFPGCECPEGFCRNDYRQCVPIADPSTSWTA